MQGNNDSTEKLRSHIKHIDMNNSEVFVNITFMQKVKLKISKQRNVREMVRNMPLMSTKCGLY